MPALAQSGESRAAADADTSQNEIVVTALRRESTVQTTPMAITALTGETLTNAGVVDVLDYAKFAPSLRIIDLGPGQRRISLRGIQASGEPTVGTYFDDVALTGSVGTASDAAGRTGDFTMFDVDRVEVLRGPQGTLYGAGAMGGAIRVITNKPTQKFEGLVDAQISTTRGGDKNHAINAMVNVPLVEDLIAARAVMYRRFSGGYVDNTFLGRDNVNEAKVTGGRLTVRFTPTETFTLDASAMYEDVEAISPIWQANLGAYKNFEQVLAPNNGNSQLYSLTANWDFGPAALTSVTSYQERKTEDGFDDTWYTATFRTPGRCATVVNGGAACSPTQLTGFFDYVDSLFPMAAVVNAKVKDFAQEVRLSSTGEGAFSWTLGGFYQKRKNEGRYEDVLADAATGEIIKPLTAPAYRRRVRDELRQLAAFGEGTFAVTPELKLTAGIRYFDYDKTVGGFVDIPLPLIGAGALPPKFVDASEKGTLLKFNASWEASSDIFLYATAAQGFRPGGANSVIGLPGALTSYEADRLWNYEAGTKLQLLDRKLTLNLAAYQVDWDNIIVRGRTLDGVYSFLSNAGAARIRGLEAEAFLRPTRGLQFTLSGNYNSAKLSEDQINANITAAGRKGDRIPFVPRWTGAIGFEYTVPVSDGVDLFLRSDANYVGASYSEFRPTNVNRKKVESYTLVNARIGVDFEESNTGLYLFVNNMFDKVAINRQTQASWPSSNNTTSSPPRTIGINLRKGF
ncbi:ligand-gated channel protein [Sphingomonas sp. SRS2]|nr:ligand-gated channel protein [Sphingomonas sp. SRS2]